MRVVSEVAGVSGEGELSFGVEPVVQTGATCSWGEHYYERIFRGVALRLGVDVV